MAGNAGEPAVLPICMSSRHCAWLMSQPECGCGETLIQGSLRSGVMPREPVLLHSGAEAALLLPVPRAQACRIDVDAPHLTRRRGSPSTAGPRRQQQERATTFRPNKEGCLLFKTANGNPLKHKKPHKKTQQKPKPRNTPKRETHKPQRCFFNLFNISLTLIPWRRH
jgi:hypothetical protein